MYIPNAFAIPQTAALHDLIDEYGFGSLISGGPDGPEASHLPFCIDRGRGRFGTLSAHLARANPHWRLLDGASVLVVFMGPHGYVSPAWYATKPAVPTWNYAAVHARGTVRVVADTDAVRAIVSRLTERHEAGRLPAWSVEDLPPEFLDRMVRDIVGIDIAITALEGKRKLSQNRSVADRRGAIGALRATDRPQDQALAAAMERAEYA